MAAPTGMSVPGMSDLGLGGDLSDQLAGESDEQRKKRLAGQRQQQMMGAMVGTSALGIGATGYTAAGGIGGFGGR